MVVWRGDDDDETTTHYSSVRPPGGAWGAPQVIVSEEGLSSCSSSWRSRTARRSAVWTDDSPAGTYVSFRMPNGTWGPAEQVVADGSQLRPGAQCNRRRRAPLPGSYPGYAFSKYRPAGGAWGGAVEVLKHNYPDTMQGLMVEFDGQGRTVALAEFREFTDTVRVNVGTGGGWGATDQVLDDDGTNPPDPSSTFAASLDSSVIRRVPSRSGRGARRSELQRRRGRLSFQRSHVGDAAGLRRAEPLHERLGGLERRRRDPDRGRAQSRRRAAASTTSRR